MWMCQTGLTCLSHGYWPAIKIVLLIKPVFKLQTHKVLNPIGINAASLFHCLSQFIKDTFTLLKITV